MMVTGSEEVFSAQYNIGAFGDHLAILIGPVRAALAVLCQATLHFVNYVTERRTVFARGRSRQRQRLLISRLTAHEGRAGQQEERGPLLNRAPNCYAARRDCIVEMV